MALDNEPSLEQIDDYNGKESPEKRRLIYLVVLFILVVGAAYAIVKYNFNTVDDYIGDEQKPGINTTKGY